MGRRSRSRSDEHIVELPYNASPIAESDYFQKSDEFRVWLRDEKRKYFDELSSDRARSYFRKFVKAWNRGKLPRSLYEGSNLLIPATQQTAYKWSFASKLKASGTDDQDLRSARQEVNSATYGGQGSSRGRYDSDDEPEVSRSRASGSARVAGPTLPTQADLILAREMAAESQQTERSMKRKREKAEDKERIEDMVGPREVGREGQLEKKRAKRENDRAFREKGDDGLEMDEKSLLGGGDSFKAAVAKRDANKDRYKQKGEEQAALVRERMEARKEKESATMAMFQQLAKQRFG